MSVRQHWRADRRRSRGARRGDRLRIRATPIPPRRPAAAGDPRLRRRQRRHHHSGRPEARRRHRLRGAGPHRGGRRPGGDLEWKRGLAMMTEQDRATYDRLAKVAGEVAAETNYEAIAAAKPDLIVIGVPKPVLGRHRHEAAGEHRARRRDRPRPLPAAWRELSRRQSDAAGRAAHFQAAKEAYEKKAAELKEKYGSALDRPEVRARGCLRRGRQGHLPPRVRQVVGHQHRPGRRA